MMRNVHFIPLLVGHPGIGKSDLAYQIAKLFCKGKEGVDWMFVTLYPALMNVEDINGMPCIIGRDKADFIPFGQIHTLLTSQMKVFCFIDELGQAPKPMKNGIAQFILSRMINGKPLVDVTFFAATNPQTSFAGTSPMVSQLLARLFYVEFTPHQDDWIQWALNNKISGEGIEFINSHPDIITEFDEEAARLGEPQSNARSFTWTDQVLYQGGLFDPVDAATTDGEEALAEEFVVEAASGYLGEKDAKRYMLYMRKRKLMPKGVDIVRDPDNCPLPDDQDIRFLTVRSMAAKTKESVLDPFIRYASRMGNSMLGLYASECMIRHPDLKSTREYKDLVMNNPKLFGTEDLVRRTA